MPYVLIPVGDMAAVRLASEALEVGGLSGEEWAVLARAFERTVQTSELLVTYAVGISGKPSKH